MFLKYDDFLNNKFLVFHLFVCKMFWNLGNMKSKVIIGTNFTSRSYSIAMKHKEQGHWVLKNKSLIYY